MFVKISIFTTKKTVFSPVLGQKIVANLPPHSIQVHQNHPKASSEVGASNVLSVSDFETLRKDSGWVFQFLKAKISSLNGDEYVHTVNFPLVNLKRWWGSLLRVSGSDVGLKQPTKDIGGANF